MTWRKIIRIDEEKCNGCGRCVSACAEGAIEIVDGKARLVSETYCDGLGACLGKCPQDAISFEERNAAPFDEAAAKERAPQLASKQKETVHACPGTVARTLKRASASPCEPSSQPVRSELSNWPVQLRLIPPDAPSLEGADLLLAADCVPFALADFHGRFLRGRPVVVGCPKLDDPECYVRKLADILTCSSVRSLTVVHMEVPCCSGLIRIAEAAIEAARRDVPFYDITVSIQGEVIAEEEHKGDPRGRETAPCRR